MLISFQQSSDAYKKFLVAVDMDVQYVPSYFMLEMATYNCVNKCAAYAGLRILFSFTTTIINVTK
jgi:hypothetical protein